MAKKTSLSTLSKLWLEAKQSEDNARQHRIALEDEISNLIPGPEEGSASALDSGYKVTVTRKYTRALDLDEYAEVRAALPAGLDPVTYKPEVNTKILRAIEAANPAVFKLCQKFITVKPAKTAVKVEVVEC